MEGDVTSESFTRPVESGMFILSKSGGLEISTAVYLFMINSVDLPSFSSSLKFLILIGLFVDDMYLTFVVCLERNTSLLKIRHIQKIANEILGKSLTEEDVIVSYEVAFHSIVHVTLC